MEVDPSEKAKRKAEAHTKARADIIERRHTRSRAASSVLIVYEYISERELNLISTLAVQANQNYKLEIGQYNIIVDVGDNKIIVAGHNIPIEASKLCVKQKEAWNFLTLNNDGVHPAVIIEKLCVLLASILPVKLLNFAKFILNKESKEEIDELTAMLSTLGQDARPSNTTQMDMDKLFDTRIKEYISVEVGHINESFASISLLDQTETPIMIDYEFKTPIPVKPLGNEAKVKTISSRIIPKSFGKTINGVKKIAKKPTEPSNLKKVQINILSKTIDKAIHNLSNLIISATNMREACILEYNKSTSPENEFADPVNARTYLDNIPAFGQSLQNGIKDLKDLKNKNHTASSVEEIKDKICRIKAYMHATLNSYNHQHSVIKFGMGAASNDYEHKSNEDDAMDLVAGMMGIALQDSPASSSTAGGKGGRKKPCMKGGFTGYNELIEVEGKTRFKFVSPFEYIFSKAEIENMYNFLLVQILEYTKTSIKHALLIAEIKTCINQLHIWSEIEALYHYDVLNFTFAYTRAQNEFIDENVNQDEDGMFVYLVDDKPSKKPIKTDFPPLELKFKQNMRRSRIQDYNQSWRSTNPVIVPTTTSDGRVNKFKKGGANEQLIDEQKHAAIDLIARQTGIVDLPGDITQEIAESLGPYYALMMRLAGISVDVAPIGNAEIEKVIATLPSHAEIIRLYVYSEDSEWTLKPLPDIPKDNFKNYLQQTKTSELKTIVSVRFCDAKGKVLKSPNPDPSRYIFKAALDAYVALLGPS